MEPNPQLVAYTAQEIKYNFHTMFQRQIGLQQQGREGFGRIMRQKVHDTNSTKRT